MVAYHMRAVFLVSISLKDLNFMTEMLDGSRVVLEDATAVTVDQVIKDVPTKETLDIYAEAIKKRYNNSDTVQAETVKFSHYELFEKIDVSDITQE